MHTNFGILLMATAALATPLSLERRTYAKGAVRGVVSDVVDESQQQPPQVLADPANAFYNKRAAVKDVSPQMLADPAKAFYNKRAAVEDVSPQMLADPAKAFYNKRATVEDIPPQVLADPAKAFYNK